MRSIFRLVSEAKPSAKPEIFGIVFWRLVVMVPVLFVATVSVAIAILHIDEAGESISEYPWVFFPFAWLALNYMLCVFALIPTIRYLGENEKWFKTLALASGWRRMARVVGEIILPGVLMGIYFGIACQAQWQLLDQKLQS